MIHTHGEGELLTQVFQAISKILYGEGTQGLEQTFHALIRISLTVGAFCALLLAFFRQRFEPLIRSFLLPGLIIIGFLLVPKTSVEIEKGKPIEVPFFLGKFAVWTSYSFEQLHDLFKKAIGDTYPWTTNIYESKNFLAPGSVPLTDPHVEENFREFCRECVFRDLGLGLYEKKELAQTPDLLEFLAAKTSAKRAVSYNGQAISCKEAAENLKKSIKAQSLKASAANLLINAPNLAEQKVAIDLLQQEIFRPDLKKESFGALGSIVLMSLRSFFEAVLYLIFPLIVLLSLLSFGIRTALLWVRSIVWVYTWPIFYLAADLFLDTIWKFRGGHTTLNLENASRLSELYSSMEMIACATLASIPFLSWALIKGSISQLVHISSALPTQETIEKTVEAAPPLPQDDDLSRQTPHFEVFSSEAPDSFRANIEGAKLEERIDSLHNSLSSIRESVKDSSTSISKAIKETSRTAQIEPSPATSPPALPAEEEKWGSSRMHIPSHGSWKDTEPV